MLKLRAYLRTNGFKTFIVSGGGIGEALLPQPAGPLQDGSFAETA
ncbi:hypothetical protein ACVWW1_006924 [Bradyrhizobium sp. JR3.5]